LIGGERSVLKKAGRRGYNAMRSHFQTVIWSNHFLSQTLSVRIRFYLFILDILFCL